MLLDKCIYSFICDFNQIPEDYFLMKKNCCLEEKTES